jgi:uncharacterized protein involved in response to NO
MESDCIISPIMGMMAMARLLPDGRTLHNIRQLTLATTALAMAATASSPDGG